MDGSTRWVTVRCYRCGAEIECNPGDDIDMCAACDDLVFGETSRKATS